jgi:hypothetical protein
MSFTAGDTEALCIVGVVGYGSGTVSLSVYINKYSGEHWFLSKTTKICGFVIIPI